MTEVFLTIMLAAVGLPVFIVCAGLALRRRTRYFAIPPVLALLAGGIAYFAQSDNLARLVFIGVSSFVVIVFASVLFFVAAIAAIGRT